MTFNLRAVAVATALAVTVSGFATTSASADYRGHHAPIRHGGGGIHPGVAIGAGILGAVIIDSVIRAQQQRVPNEVPVQVERPRTQPRAKPPVVKQDPKLATVRVAHPVYTTPVLPDVTEDKTCGTDCGQLWQSIQRYKDMIKEDTRKLDERKADLITKQNEAQTHLANAKSARTAADRNYHQQMANIAQNSAKETQEGIDRLQKIIDDEQAILRDRIAQYEDCVKRSCAAQAANKQ